MKLYRIFNTTMILIILAAGYVAISMYMVYLNGECPNEWECPPLAYGVSILVILTGSCLLIVGFLLRKIYTKFYKK